MADVEEPNETPGGDEPEIEAEPEGEAAEAEPSEPEAKSEAEGEPELTPEEPESPPPLETSAIKKKRIQVNPNTSLKDAVSNVHYLSALPAVPEEARVYTPILYTFRVKTNSGNTRLKNITAKPPPFYLQLDHTIAVIWTLFNKDSNRDNLGIVQLQWAFHFLNSIFNQEGVHPKDVQLCIDTIQNYLIDEYADMSEESVVYGLPKCDDKFNVDKSLPFSINYSQMIEKAPDFTFETDVEMETIDKSLIDELEKVKKVVGIESIDLSNVVSKDQVMNILHDWKNEQIEKIQTELRMLYVVEDMMKNSDEQNFEGYTDEKQFEIIFNRNKETSS